MVFPIRMVMSRCSGDSFNAATAFEPFFPSLTRVLAFARVMEIRATSELEKNADRRTQMTKRQNFDSVLNHHRISRCAGARRLFRIINKNTLSYSEWNLIKPALYSMHSRIKIQSPARISIFFSADRGRSRFKSSISRVRDPVKWWSFKHSITVTMESSRSRGK